MSESLISARLSEPEWAAFAAIDWADQKNFWRLVPAGSQRSEQGELENTPEAVEIWAAGLEKRFDGRPIAVCLEQSRGPLVYMLTKYPHLVLFPVHPTTAARYRETFRSFRRQERSERYGLPVGSVVAPSRTPASPATGYVGNPPVAFPGGGAPAHRG